MPDRGPAQPDQPPRRPPPHDALPAARFHEIEPIAAGAFAYVFRALDAEGRRVAVKLLAPEAAARPEAVWQFGAEYRLLARLAHPAFPSALEQGIGPAGLPWFSMTLAAGERPGASPLPAARARAAVVAIADALAHLHGLGLIHGDLKPENVLLDEEGRATLLDLGLAVPIGTPRAAIAGTLEYLAPEALRRSPAAPAADLYALGALAYGLRAGRPPFTAESPDAGGPAALVRAHLCAPPPPLAGRVVDDDEELDATIMALLAKDPGARPASAASLAARLQGRPAPAADPVALLPGALVARDEALAAWARVLAAPGSAWLTILGGPGLGKSRLLDELRMAAALAGRAWAGASAAGAADAPGAPLRALLAQALAAAGPAGGEPAPYVAAWLAGEMPAELRDLEPPARRLALHAALARALAVAAEAAGGLALGLDDWHLADDASRELLAHLRRATAGAAIAWAIARDDAAEAPGGTADETIVLAPLTREEAERLLDSRLGATPAGLAAAIVPAADGRPQLLDLLLAHLIGEGRLIAEPDGWRWAPDAGTAAPLPAGLAAATRARLAMLDEPARKLVAVAGVAAPAGALPLPLLADAAGLPDGEREPAIERLAATGLLAIEGGRGRLGVPGLNEAACETLDAPARARVASTLARALAGAAAQDDGALTHLPHATLQPAATLALAGDDPPSACRLAAEAGRRSLAMTAGRDALRLLSAAAERLPPAAPAAERLAVLLPLADALRGADRLDEALPAYERATELAAALDRPAGEAAALIGLAKVRQLKGDYVGALEAYEGAAARAAAVGDDAAVARAEAAAARVLLFRGEPARARTLCAAAVERARRADAPAILASALNLEGYMLAQLDQNQAPVALARLAEAIAICERLGDRYGLGMALDNLGNVHLALGDLADAATAFDRGLSLAREHGGDTDVLPAAVNRLIVAAERGEVALAETLGAETLARADAAGRQFPRAAALGALAQLRARTGRGEEAIALADEAIATARKLGNALLEEHARTYRVEALLLAGDAAAAAEELAAAAELNRASGAGETGARQALLAAELASSAGRHAEARQVAGAWYDAPNRLAAGDARRLLARLALADGDAAAAGRHAAAALALAEAWRAPWHEAESHLLAGLAARVAGDMLGAEGHARAALTGARAAASPRAAEAARRLLAELGADRRADRGEAGMLAPGALARAADALARAEDERAIGQAALHALIELIGADRGYMLAYEGGRLRRVVVHGMDYETEVARGFSSSIAEHALFSGEPIYVADARSDEAWREAASVAALELRTVVALPLAAASRLIGVLYLERDAIEPMLAESDVAHLAALARLAASAMLRERARALAEAEAARGRVCAEALRGLAATAGPEAALLALLDAALAATDAERALWLARDAAGVWHARALRARGREAVFDGDPPFSRTVVAWAYERGEPVSAFDADEAERWAARPSVRALGLRTIWCVPAAGGLLYMDATDVREGESPDAALATLAALVTGLAPLLGG